MKRICLLFLILSACAPKAVVKTTKSYNPAQAYESFVVFDINEEVNFTKDQIIGDIQIKDGGLTLSCDYQTVTNIAVEKAKKIGANAIKIYEHKLPDIIGSTCHRIKVTALRIDHIWKYEKEIPWHKERSLQIKDFKGDPQNRPFQAATACYFTYQFYGAPISGKITVKTATMFDCEKSYFTLSEDSLFTLKHEQLHFDISELYSRKFLRAIKETIFSYKDLEANHNKIFDRILNEHHKEQDRYDYEVYNDRGKQSGWQLRIQQELKLYEEFRNRELVISPANKVSNKSLQ